MSLPCHGWGGGVLDNDDDNLTDKGRSASRGRSGDLDFSNKQAS